MLFLPLPIVLALMLSIALLIQRDRLSQAPAGKAFSALLILYCFQLVLIGLRWGYEVTLFLPLQAVLAALWCPLAWFAFRSLSREQTVIEDTSSQLPYCAVSLYNWKNDWTHALPVTALIISILFWPVPIDIILICTYAIYSALLVNLALKGTDALASARFSNVQLGHRALWLTGVLLAAFVIIDIFISIDIRFYQGQYSAIIIALANLPMIIILGYCALMAGQVQSIESIDKAQQVFNKTCKEKHSLNADLEEAQQLMPLLYSLVVEQKLYRDTELNLQRLARKCGVPSRRVSKAVNILTKQNVSQWVNEQRIQSACELLKNSEKNITLIMQDVGFITKSNFNREFKRVTGDSPSQWRKKQAG
jgi:AraC-like DNA-binding protein